MITIDGREWGTYVLRRNTQLEVITSNRGTDYLLEFPDDDNMVWMLETDKGLVPAVKWRR